ncbi:acyltransferase family protein [Photobacterium sanguinicancri]|uniref:acyltransferase family protein n=1 Tax=Photobacterium sanguinicancri TaxID=875932 RepID=UPI000AA64E3C|nr:acyltransferase family protein [Photobacterium sanguinicancri]
MLSYRKELDGLRALAVIAVIVYHANLKLFGVQLFQGGFFGVDVFFVLSGYLITGIIRSQMEQGTFSFRDFYWRRAKRIVPALLTMLLVTSGLAYLILLPDDLVTYAKSLQSALYFGSNHFFYGEDSYTAAASIYRPLLHTWSLSVEWQFYVVFPFIVWTINRFCPRYMFGILLALALVSLQISSFIVKINPDMAFYLLPTRAWELILGGLVTFYNRKNIEKSEKDSFASIAYKSLPIIGLFLVAHSMVFIGHDVPHPSFITLLPVLGTCLFIMFSHKGELSNDVMSLKPIVGVGLISYSLYLWHQPVFVFFRILKHDYFRFEQFLLLISISLILSILTFLLVEKKTRKTVSRTLLSFNAVVIFCLILFINESINSKGMNYRLNVPQALITTNTRYMPHCRGEQCSTQNISGGINAVLIGDSHMAQYYMTDDYFKEKGINVIKFIGSACNVMVKTPAKTDSQKQCNELVDTLDNFDFSEMGPSIFIYSVRSELYGNHTDDIVESLSSLANKLKDNGHYLLINLDTANAMKNVPLEASKALRSSIKGILLPNEEFKNLDMSSDFKLFKSRMGELNEKYESIRNIGNVIVINAYEKWCSEYNMRCEVHNKKNVFYSGYDHLTPEGAEIIFNSKIKPVLDRKVSELTTMID